MELAVGYEMNGVCLIAIGLLLLLFSYLCGSIPFGYLAGKWKGLDLRQHGSGNIGATNAIRVLGKKTGIPVFILDFVKGYLPVALARHFLLLSDLSPESASVVTVLMALAAVMGHTYPVWLGFKGGKGVATGAGVVLALAPFSAGVAIAIWAIVFMTSRYVSLASVVAAACFPFLVLFQSNYFSNSPIVQGSLPVVIFSFIVALLVIIKHKDNIRRLIAGEEHRAFSRKEPDGHS